MVIRIAHDTHQVVQERRLPDLTGAIGSPSVVSNDGAFSCLLYFIAYQLLLHIHLVSSVFFFPGDLVVLILRMLRKIVTVPVYSV